MELKIAEKIRKLRVEKNVTQEELAAHISISAQAVSKWERGEGYPDITLLPRIALFFGVTTDELLGVAEEQIEDQIFEWVKLYMEYDRNGETEKSRDLWKKAYETYPNNHEVVFHYMYNVHGEDNELRISLAKKILTESTNETYRDGAREIMVHALKNLGRIEEAKEYAKSASDLWTCQERLYNVCLEGDDRIAEEQLFLMHAVDVMKESADAIAENTGDNKKKIAAYEFVIDLFDLLFPDGDHGFYLCRVCDAAENLAEAYLAAGRRDDCLRALRRAADSAINFASRPKVSRRTSPLVDMINDETDNTSPGVLDSVTELFRNALSKPVFDPVRDAEEFKQIEADVNAYLAEAKAGSPAYAKKPG